MIEDAAIREAAQEDIINQYKDFVHKIANRYRNIIKQNGRFDIDDLMQSGFIGLMKAQKTYNPEKGITFLSWSARYINLEIRYLIGIKHDNSLPDDWQTDSLDRNISGADDLTMIDTVKAVDPTPSAEERLTEEAEKEEIAAAVRAAVARLKSEKQRYVIELVWLEGCSRNEAAEKMETTPDKVTGLDRSARDNLKRDRKLRTFAVPLFHVGVSAFHSTQTSATEKAVLWLEKEYDQIYGEGAFLGL